MAAWKTKINLRQYLGDDDETPEGVLEAAKGIKKEIVGNMMANIHLGHLATQLLKRTEKAVEAGLDYYECCDIFNGWLAQIYDAADLHLIWIGG